MDYDNFDIIIHESQQSNAGNAQAAHNGNGPKLRRFPVTVLAPGRDPKSTSLTYAEGEDVQFKKRIKFNEEGYLAKPDDIEALGAEIRRRLFADDQVWGVFRDMRQRVSKIKGLRIRLYIAPHAAEISRLPWEYCFDEVDQRLYIGLDRHTPIVRAIPLGLEKRDLGERDKLKVLVLVASPANEKLAQLYDEKIDIKKHLNEIFLQKLAPGIDATVKYHATVDMLREELREGDYDIFQFLGHGMLVEGKGARLFFEKENLEPHRATHEQVAQYVRNNVKLCLLTACESAEHDPGDMFSGLAQRLVLANIPAVVGMQIKVSHQAALDFTETFYRYLIERKPIDEALIAAREDAYAKEDDPNSWGIPVLYLQAEDGRILPDLGAKDADAEAEALVQRQRATNDEPQEARPKGIDNLLEALSTLGFNGQRNTFKAFRKGSRSLALVLAGSENADEYGLGWQIEVLRGELRRSSKKLVLLKPLNCQVFGSSAEKLWREAATSCGLAPGDADQVAEPLVGQLDTHSLIFVVKVGKSTHMETLLDSFWARIQDQVDELPVPRGADQSMILLLIVDQEDELADYYHDLLNTLPPVRRITESEFSKWHAKIRNLLPANMQAEDVVPQIMHGGPIGSGLIATQGSVDDILENIDHFCPGITEYIGK